MRNPFLELKCTHSAERGRGAHLDVAIMRSLVTIHALHRGTFPLHQMDPEEGFESHGIIHVRVMRRQVHPANDEQTIHLQRDRTQSPWDQPCMTPCEFAANSEASSGPGQEQQNSLLHSQTAFQPLAQTICTPSTPWVKRVSLQGFLHHWKKLRPLLLQTTCLECRIQRERPHSKADSNCFESSCWQIFQQMNSASHDYPSLPFG